MHVLVLIIEWSYYVHGTNAIIKKSFIVCTLPDIITAITSNSAMRWKELVETENCALMGYYAASSGNLLPTFRYDLSVPSSRIKNTNVWILDHSRWDWDPWLRGSTVFWAITQLVVVIYYRRFGKTYRFQFQGPRISVPSAMVNNPNIWVLDDWRWDR